MARKYELITELYQRTVAGITAPSVWQRFLNTACRNFRLSFDEQILLFAQRPDATAVLTIEGKNGWNERFGRWVNRGSTGIAFFDKEYAGGSRLKYYFDISDTHEGRYSRPVPIWTMRPEFMPAIMETLENSFGELESKESFPLALLSAAQNAVEDNMADYLTELRYYKEGSFLEELDDLNIEVQYRRVLTNSVGYMLLARCGIDPSAYFSDDDFRDVTDFNTPNTLNALGVATGDIGQMCLSEISRTALSLQRQAEKRNRTFAGRGQVRYPMAEQNTQTPERSEEHDRDHIHDAGRLQTAQPSAAPGAGGTPWEIRIDAPQISEAEPPRDLHESADQRQAEPAPDGDRADGLEADGAAHSADGGGRGRDGGTESRRSDEVGGLDEQHPALGRGDGAERPDLQLTPQEPEPETASDWSAEEVPAAQQTPQEPNQETEYEETTENAGGEELPAFLNDKLIMAIVANPDDDLKYKKHQIELYFSVHPDEAERAEYLKSAYQDRYTELIVDGVRVGYKPQENGLLMWEGAYLSRTSESVFSWGIVAEWTAQLIEKKEYFINTQITPPKSQDTQQLSLFDFADFNVPSSEPEQLSFIPRPQLPQQIIDEALCIGANDRNSRLIICAYFMKDKPLEDNAAFLQKHYGINGAGFYVNDRQYAIWYNGDGIRVASGDSAQGRSATLIPWEQAAKRIRELLDLGRYMPQSELDQVSDYEIRSLADRMLLMSRDISEEYQDAGYLPTMRLVYSSRQGFPEMTNQLQELLADSDMLQKIVEEWRIFSEAHGENQNILRYRSYRPKEILEQLQDLQREPIVFTAAENYNPQRRLFISGDEIDNLLRGGRHGTDYRLAVYSFYRNHSDRKERENFLKHYHGEYSGYGNGNDDVTYQLSKGVYFSHGSITEPYAKVELKWNAVEKRVSAMIGQGKFLTDEDRAAMPQYEKHQLARDIQSFFSGVPQEQPRPYPYGFDFYDAIKVIEPQLDDPAKVEEIYQMMFPVWESTAQDDRMYALRQSAFENLFAYRQGTFTLFAEKKEPVPPQAVQEPQKTYDLGFGHLGNGLTVWNRLEEVHGDYRTVAHIDPDRTVQIYDEEMPQEVRDRIQKMADTAEMTVSATQDAPIFAAPPKEEQPKKEEPTDPYPVLAAQVLHLIGEFDSSRMNYGQNDAQAVENIAQQLHDPVQRQEIRVLLQSFLDHADMEEEIAADIALCMEQIDELPQSLMPNSALLEQAKELIDQFCQAEYDSYADFNNLEEIGIAYTTVTDEEIPIQVNVDLVNYRMERYLNGQLLERRQYDSLEALIRNELTDLAFDDLISVSEEELASIGVSQDDYQLLSRLKADCDYYLGAGGRAEKHLWAGSIEAQIAKMRELYASLSEKPEWLTEQDIDRYESQMTDGPELPQQQKEETAQLAPKRVLRERITFAPLYPEIPADQRHNFHITDAELGYGTRSEKYAANVAAIRCLKQIEAENRLATPEEQETLSRYVGWGGLADCFDERHGKYLELKSLLDEDEYAAARASSLTAFYTSPVIIRAMYQALSQMGFQEGNVLEPSCGVGNFIGMMPEELSRSKAYGVEIDSISGRIARQLYQNSSIAVAGFEKVQMPDSFFDVAIGNVPFGDFKVLDKRYDKNHWLIHDYFFGKTLDKVRPGGMIAFITSKGTMDKENSAVRKYLAQRADLIGAIRLPNNAFKANAGTEVTSDILFLQKRDRMIDIEPDWVHLDTLRVPTKSQDFVGEEGATEQVSFSPQGGNEQAQSATTQNGIRMNRYFVQHPEMVLGEMVMESTRFGMDGTCKPYEDADLAGQLSEAIQNLHAEITAYEVEELEDEEDHSIPADPAVRNFSYTISDGKVYFRENSRMYPIEVSVTAENRIRGMIALRDCVRKLIEYQTEGYPDEDILKGQAELNRLYDEYTKKYGLLSSRGNSLAFGEDSSYCLLCSLEVLDEEGNLTRKADMFTRRTIRPHEAVTSVDTASEALAVSIAEKAGVDLGFMASLMGGSEKIPQIVEALKGVIFKDPNSGPFDLESSGERWAQGWQTADEYLSGNVRVKLREARQAAEDDPFFAGNVTALEAVQPIDLTAAEIGVRIGANWVPVEIYQQFMVETFGTSAYARSRIKILRSSATGQWAITEKNADRSNVKSFTTYGSKRMNAYYILEQTLNQKDARVYDYVEDDNGNKKAVLNKKETAIVQDRQEIIKARFAEWLWRDIDRRERLCRIYNETFNSIRPREYDGQHITFPGMNPEIVLRPHQVNAIAHIMYGGNTLLAHEVGAGKTFEMVAAAMEMKRLGLCTKSLIVVPNHITEQWAAEWLQLYPSANILVATKKDFEKQNRRKFCGRIATGDYDAIIIGHSQFEKIPMSAERQQIILQQQIDEIMRGIEEAKSAKAERYTVKQLERTRKSLEAKLKRLNDQSRKDDLVTFEELGVDRVFVDESHYFKNLFLATKMRNVGGIAQTEAQKSSDLFMKCRYLDEITGGRGMIFATGTPISNSMVELYTIQRYLQYSTLEEMGLLHFDDWASDFGETITAIELSPEGSGYRAKTRFAKFFNLPELMSTFKMVADIQTADMLQLPVPKANFHTEVITPSEIQRKMVAGLAERAEAIRNGNVDPSVDNMLKITNDGRKLALDMRLINPLAADDPNGKVAVCAGNVYRIWEQTRPQRSAQLVFCDLSTPKGDGSFNVYDDLRQKLTDMGIPAEEIAFIHDANTEARKKELFARVRAGQVRVLMGSTQKMGAGTNVQDRLIALHDLDCPWRPSDLAQRLGRIVRQGNENPEVEIFRYVTEGTFDAYLYQLVENKQKFIAQIMTSKAPVRVADDVDETALSYSEIKALATGNPLIIEKCNLDMEVGKLNVLKASHLSQRYALEEMVLRKYPAEIQRLTERIAGYEQDVQLVAAHARPPEDFIGMEILGVSHTEKESAGKAIIDACTKMTGSDAVFLGQYRGFSLTLSYDGMKNEYRMTMKGTLSHTVVLGADVFGNITRMDNLLEGFEDRLNHARAELAETQTQLENARAELALPFAREEELAEKTARLKELNILLNMDQKDKSLLDDGPEEDAPEQPKSRGYER